MIKSMCSHGIKKKGIRIKEVFIFKKKKIEKFSKNYNIILNFLAIYFLDLSPLSTASRIFFFISKFMACFLFLAEFIVKV